MSDLVLNGDRYVRFPNDEKLYNTDNVFVSMDLNLENWNQEGSSQIVGNYNSQGYGIFYIKGFENVLDYTIVDSGNSHLFYFNHDGGLVSQRNFPDLTNPLNITAFLVDHTDSKYYFDQANDTCFKFNNNNILTEQFTIPSGTISVVVPDIDGNLYFFDTQNQVIYKYSNTGVFISNLTPEYPKHNNMIVLNNGTVKTFFSRSDTPMLNDSDNNVYTLWGANIYKNGLPWFFVNPKSNNIGIDSDDNLWVVYNNNRVIKLNTDGLIIFDRQFHSIMPCSDAQCPPRPSKADSVGMSFTRVGDVEIARIILNKSNYIIDLDTNGEVINCELINNLLNTNAYPDANSSNINLVTNGDASGWYARQRFNIENNTDSNIVVRVAIQDPCDQSIQLETLTHTITGLETGTHNIAFNFNGSTGVGNLLIDGVIVDEFENDGIIYYTPESLPPYLIGANSGNFRSRQEELGLLSQTYFTGVIESLVISENMDTEFFSNRNLTDLQFELPTINPLSFKERVDKFFLFRPTGAKSTQYDINLLNTGVESETVRAVIENDVVESINETTPTHCNLQNIEWKEVVRFKNLI